MAWLHDPVRIALAIMIVAQIVIAFRTVRLRDAVDVLNVDFEALRRKVVPPPEPLPDSTMTAAMSYPEAKLAKERENSPRRFCPVDGSVCFVPECMVAGCQGALDPPGAPNVITDTTLKLAAERHNGDGFQAATRRIDESIQSTCRLVEMGQPMRVHRILEASLTDAFGTMGIDVLPGQRNWLASHLVKSLETNGFAVGEYK